MWCLPGKIPVNLRPPWNARDANSWADFICTSSHK